MLAAIRSAAVLGIEAYDVIVEVDIAAGLPAWTIVHVEIARSVGVLPRRAARFHPTRQTHRQRAFRIIQWALARRVLKRASVPLTRPRHEVARGVAHG